MTHTSTRSILLEEDIDKISHILGDDMLTMEEKERLLKTIEDVNNDEEVMKEWMLEENARLKYEGQMAYVKEEGIEQGSSIKELELIRNMLSKGYDYEAISEITYKTVEEIKEIEKSMK